MPLKLAFKDWQNARAEFPETRRSNARRLRLRRSSADFDNWLDAELQEFASLIKSVELGEADPAWIESANFRSRQLRDSATTLGFELLSFIANSLCEILDAIQADNKYNIESITCHMDALMLARQKSYRRLTPEQVPELTKGLRRVVKHVTILPPGAEVERS